jgi:hypothetical protein
MTTRIAQPHETKPPYVSPRIKAALERILEKEQALSLARSVLVELDKLPNADFTCNFVAHNTLAEVNIFCSDQQRTSMRAHLLDFPFASAEEDPAIITLGCLKEPHVKVIFHPVNINS